MSFLPRHAVFDPEHFHQRNSGLIVPSLHEPRYDFIDAAADSYAPLYDTLCKCQKQYHFSSFHDWMTTSDKGRATAATHSFCHSSVWVEAEPLDGLLMPIKPNDARRNLMVWALNRTLGSFTTFCKALKTSNDDQKFTLPEKLDAFREAARDDVRRFQPEDFSWPAQRQFLRCCIEGSNRSKQGRELEKRAREALELLHWSMQVCNKEIQVLGLDNKKHRVDILVENATHVLIIHLKSSQLIRHGYSPMYVRDTAFTTDAVTRMLAQDRQVSSMTIFAGHGWNGDRIPDLSNPVMAPDIINISRDQQRAWFREFFASSPLLEPFRPGAAKRKRLITPPPNPVLINPSDAQGSFQDI